MPHPTVTPMWYMDHELFHGPEYVLKVWRRKSATAPPSTPAAGAAGKLPWRSCKP